MQKKAVRNFTLLSILFAFTVISWSNINQNFTTANQSIKSTFINEKTNSASTDQQFESYIKQVYVTLNTKNTDLNYDVFKTAVIGYLNLKSANLLSNKQLLTIVDLNKSSSQKRLWIIDLASQKLLYHTLVAHGQGSGGDMADKFSNLENSHQSSLGFYVTSDTYFGKHGLSMKLDGMDKGFNSNAKGRSVVLHGAEYVSQEFINQHGRLGRSHGCPALPLEITSQIIKKVKDKTCLFIAGPQKDYISQYNNKEVAMINFLAANVNAAVL
ncbi:MAG: murein L,D-transpeptidase catalytic domain family protein [Flavobacterium sp.]|nr:murein L,D-transpeptidase catalytic domain family protein [Pedobacter sp.]